MTIDEVKAFFEGSKTDPEVSAYVSSLMTADAVKNFLSTNEDGQKIFSSMTDSKVTKAIESWKNNNMSKLIDEAVEKANPKETAEQKQIRELKAQFEKVQLEAKREKLLNKALSIATEKGLPTEIIEHFLGEDEETTVSNLGRLETVFAGNLNKAVENKFKDIGRDPKVPVQPTNQLTYDDLMKMDIADLRKYQTAINQNFITK